VNTLTLAALPEPCCRCRFSHDHAYRDGKIVVVPNGKIIAGNIINFSREPVRRNEFIIGVAYDPISIR
jgi:hypothetical protein